MKEIKIYVNEKLNTLKDYISTNKLKIKTVVIQVGDNPASNAYVRGKVSDAAKVGIECEVRHFPETITEQELLLEVAKCNTDPNIDGFIVQLPLPKHISEARITEAINYKKDIDGFTKNSQVSPATPYGVITYLEDNNFRFEDANCIVVGRSNIVGKPMAKLLLERSANVKVIHSKTSPANKEIALMNADLIVVATGHRNTLTDNDLMHDGQYWVNKDCFVADIGINRNEEGKLCGDCENVTVIEKSPVPSGFWSGYSLSIVVKYH